MLPKTLSELRRYMNRSKMAHDVVPEEPVPEIAIYLNEESLQNRAMDGAGEQSSMGEMFSTEFSKLAEWKQKLLENKVEVESRLKDAIEQKTKAQEEVTTLELKLQEAESEEMKRLIQMQYITRQEEANMAAIHKKLKEITATKKQLEFVNSQVTLKLQSLSSSNDTIEASSEKEKKWKRQLNAKLSDLEIENQELRRMKMALEEERNAAKEEEIRDVHDIEAKVLRRIEGLDMKLKRMPELTAQEKIAKNRLIAKLKQVKARLNRGD